MPKSKKEPKREFIILPTARKLTNDEICRCVFGKSMETLVREIRDNKDGKFNC